MKTAIRLTMLGLLMGATAVQAWALPQGTERPREARPQQRAERSRPAPARQNAARAQRGDGSAGSRSGNVSGNVRGNRHVPDMRVYGQRLRQEVAVHRTRLARLDRLDRIYSGRGMRVKVSEVRRLRNREVSRFQRLLMRFRDALGPANYERAAASLGIGGQVAPPNVTRQNQAQRKPQRSAPRARNESKTNTRRGGKEN